MTDLVGSVPTEIAYSSSTGQFRNLKTGRFVGRTAVMGLVDQEVERTKVRLQAHTRLLTQRRIDLPEWERRMAQTLKETHLRMGAFGSGGKQNLDARKFGAIGYQLRTQYAYLDEFAKDLKAGKLTAAQALRRTGLYANSIKVTFHKIEKMQKLEVEGFREAKRSLDPQAQHCQSCLQYSTRDRWRPADQVVEPGVNCECGQFCRCSIQYRYAAGRPNSAVLNQGFPLAR